MTALRSPPLPAPLVATTGRNLCDSPLPIDTCARCPACLAMASVLGCVRRCLPARAAAALASSLYFLQGTLQKIHLHRLSASKRFSWRISFRWADACVLGRAASSPGSTPSSLVRHL